MSDPQFWEDKNLSTQVIKELKDCKDKYEGWKRLSDKIKEAGELIDLAVQDSSLKEEVETEVNKLEKELAKFEIKVLLSGKFDRENAIVNINSGAGGTEACDWASMLFRMYNRGLSRRDTNWK